MRRRPLPTLLTLLVLLALAAVLFLRGGAPGESAQAAPGPAAAQAVTRSPPVARNPRRPHSPNRADRLEADAASPDEAAADTGTMVASVRVELEIRWPDGGRLDRDVLLVGRGCPVVARVSEGTGTLDLSRQWSYCALQARMTDGLLWRRTEWVEVDLAGADDQQVDLVMPDERTGGLGVAIGEVDDGIVVRRVYPGTPAAEMGLQAGDVIVEVDGLPTSALELDEFIEVATGAEGSEVELVVAYDSDTGATEEVVSVARSFLSYGAVMGYHHGMQGHGTVPEDGQ